MSLAPYNKRLQPTIASVTTLAFARLAPATLAAEANVIQTRFYLGGSSVRILALLLILGSVSNEAVAGEPWVVLAGGYGSYGLDGVTDAPTTYRGYNLEAGSMATGTSIYAAVGVDFARPWSMGFAYERNGASTSGFSDSADLQANLPLQSLRVTPCWYPLELAAFRLGVGAGLGVGFVQGDVSTTGGVFGGLEGEVGAVDLLLEGHIVGEFNPLQSIAVQATAGVRNITFSEFLVGGGALKRDDTGEVAEFDYGGWYIQLGVKWLFPNSDVGI